MELDQNARKKQIRAAMAYRKRRTTRKTKATTKKRRSTTSSKYGMPERAMSFSTGKNIQQTFKVILSENLTLGDWQGASNDPLRVRNFRMAQIVGCRKWDQYCGIFQEFYVSKVTLTVLYRHVLKIKDNGGGLVDEFRVQCFRCGVLTDARFEHAGATITALGNDVWEHPNMKFKELKEGDQCTFVLPRLKGNAYYTQAPAATLLETESFTRGFWQNTYAAAEVDNHVKVRMGQCVINNPGVNAVDYSDSVNNRVHFIVRYYVTFRGSQI